MTRSRPGALHRAQVHAALLARQAWTRRTHDLLAAGDFLGAAVAQDHAQAAADDHRLLTTTSSGQLALF